MNETEIGLFSALVSNGEYEDAIIVGRNLFNKSPDNIQIFNLYFELLCQVASSSNEYEIKKQAYDQAEIALAFLMENVSITQSSLDLIHTSKNKLNIVSISLKHDNEVYAQNYQKILREQHKKIIDRLEKIKSEINTITSRNEFEQLLSSIRDIESNLNVDEMNTEEKGFYDKLVKEYNDLISSKLSEFERLENIAYNKKAVDAFSEAFDDFKKNQKNKYSSPEQIIKLAKSSLFSFDPSRLFNESLIFYNHIYSYIFSKLDDDGKLALTSAAIDGKR